MQAYSLGGPSRLERNALQLLERFIENRNSIKPIRYDYGFMLKNAQVAVPKERLYINFFETFMSQAEIKKFCEFMGIDHIPAKMDEPRLVGRKVELAVSDRIRLRDSLKDQYCAVEEILGKLPERWCETLSL